MIMTPQFDLVALRPEKESETSAGGILLPGGNPDKTTARGVVVYVGPGLVKPDGSGYIPLGISPGDLVIYSTERGHARDVVVPTPEAPGGEKLVLVRSNNIFGRLSFFPPQKDTPHGRHR